MQVLKSLLLGSAVGFVAFNAAQAADLPSRKAEPVQYVKICSAYGEGFFFIPGADTCLRIGGYVRAEYSYASPQSIVTIPSYPKYTGAGFAAGKIANASVANAQLVPSGAEDLTGMQMRGRIQLDARSNTAMGTLRTYVVARAMLGSGLYGDNYTTGLYVGQAGATSVTLEQAIVQYAGFTFGRTTSEVFAFMPGINWAAQSKTGYDGAINLLSYTATFGGGFSGTIGLEDRSGMSSASHPAYNAFNFYNGPVAGTPLQAPAGSFSSVTNTAAFVNGPTTWPGLAANLRLDQSWGSIQIMGDVIQNSASSVFTPGSAGGSNNITLTQTGWAVGAGVKINLPMLAAGDVLYAQISYADGDLDELASQNTSAVTSAFGRELGGLMRFDRNLYVSPGVGMANCTATTLNSGCFKTEQTTGWAVAASFVHYWTPTVRQEFFGSYMSLTPGHVTRDTDWTLGGLSSASLYRLATHVIWSPVKNFDLGPEIAYVHLDQKLAHAPGYAATCQPGTQLATNTAVIPAGCNGIGNIKPSSGVIETRLRVTRQF